MKVEVKYRFHTRPKLYRFAIIFGWQDNSGIVRGEHWVVEFVVQFLRWTFEWMFYLHDWDKS